MAAELTAAEAAELELAGELDAGELAEALAAAAHTVAYQADVQPTELRQLAAYALEQARRFDTARDLPDD